MQPLLLNVRGSQCSSVCGTCWRPCTCLNLQGTILQLLRHSSGTIKQVMLLHVQGQLLQKLQHTLQQLLQIPHGNVCCSLAEFGTAPCSCLCRICNGKCSCFCSGISQYHASPFDNPARLHAAAASSAHSERHHAAAYQQLVLHLQGTNYSHAWQNPLLADGMNCRWQEGQLTRQRAQDQSGPALLQGARKDVALHCCG
jgi:hypothetical protein